MTDLDIRVGERIREYEATLREYHIPVRFNGFQTMVVKAQNVCVAVFLAQRLEKSPFENPFFKGDLVPEGCGLRYMAAELVRFYDGHSPQLGG